MCLFYNFYHSLMFSCFILHVRERSGSLGGPTQFWLDDDDDDGGGGVLFTELQHMVQRRVVIVLEFGRSRLGTTGLNYPYFYRFFHMMIYCIKIVHDTMSAQTPLSTNSLCISKLMWRYVFCILCSFKASIYYHANSRICLKQARSSRNRLFCMNRHRLILLLYVTLADIMNLKLYSTNIQLVCANKMSSL